jgi:hypothetical protein
MVPFGQGGAIAEKGEAAMSLVTLLGAHPEIRRLIPNLKSDLVKSDGAPMLAADWKTPIVVASIGKPHETATIGTAFDYLARAVLTRRLGYETQSFVTKEWKDSRLRERTKSNSCSLWVRDFEIR